VSKRVLVGIAVALLPLIGLLAVPVKMRCGHPGAACATAPDEQDYVHYYCVVKPLGVSLIEDLAAVGLSIRCTSGVDRMKA
jgi:hypothetical protein